MSIFPGGRNGFQDWSGLGLLGDAAQITPAGCVLGVTEIRTGIPKCVSLRMHPGKLNY